MAKALNIEKYYVTKNDCYKKGATRKPIGIQIHTIGCAQGTAKAVADYWNQSGIQACVTYIVDADISGHVLQILPEDYYTWADAGYGNRNLITIEICESDFMRYTGGANYVITNDDRFKADVLQGYDTAVALCASICKRYDWDPMKVLDSGLYSISSHNEGRMAGLSSAHVDPTHLWPKFGLSMDTFRKAVKAALKSGSFNVVDSDQDVKYYRVRKSWTDEKSQLGAYENLGNAKDACPSGYSVFDSTGKNVYTNKSKTSGTQAADFAGLSESAAASKILELIHATDKSGILNSVSAAQMILESGFVTTSLAKSANNCFGMKANLSSNAWSSPWDGVSKTTILTTEVYNGKYVQIYDDFRKYPCIEDSIQDHAAYLLGAMNGKVKRYDGLLDAANYTEAITIIKNGGYATDPNYISKICSLIMRFGLDKYDPKAPAKPKVEVKVEPVKPAQYAAQVGCYKLRRNAALKVSAMKEKHGKKCTIYETGGSYYVFCGVFKSMANATKRVNELKKLKVEAFVKQI